MAIFYTASLASGAFGGLLAGAITGGLDGVGNTRGWKWLFIIEGLITVVFAALAFFILPDYPHNTMWLSDDERALAVLRLTTSSSPKATLGHKDAFLASVCDWKTWLCTLGYMGITSAGTISYFLPSLVASLGYTGVTANYMTVPIYMSILVVVIAVGYASDRAGDKPLFIVGSCVFGGISFIIVALVKQNVVRYVFIVFGGAGIWSATPLFLSFTMQTFQADKEKRAISLAIVNGLGNLASVYGSYIWPSNTAPQYLMGFGCTTGFIFLGAIVTLVHRLVIGDLSKQHAQVEEDSATMDQEIKARSSGQEEV